MSLVHDRLYANQDLSAIDFSAYLDQLKIQIMQSYHPMGERVALQMLSEPILISIDKAVPLALVVNELIVNALKYAFPAPRAGQVDVRFYQQDDGLILEVEDDGIGVGSDTFSDSLSTVILKGLVEDQLKGSLTMSSEEGSSFTVTLPFEKIKRRV